MNTNKNFFRTVYDAMVDSRMRQAERYVARYHVELDGPADHKSEL